jgi:hypothetical protein
VKYAEIFVALDGRRPVAVRHTAFGYLAFDGEGRFDAGEWEQFEQVMIQRFQLETNSRVAGPTVRRRAAQQGDRRARELRTEEGSRVNHAVGHRARTLLLKRCTRQSRAG